jgi:hypothetical protein
MNWKRWRMGLVFSVVCGLLTAGAGLADQMSWRSFVAVLCASILTNLVGFLKQHPLESVKDDESTPGNASALVLWLCVAAVVFGSMGCTRIRTVQEETDLDGYTRTTTFSGMSFFDSKSELARAHTTMTDKSQGVTVSGLMQEASGTNAVNLVETAVKAAVTGAVKAVAPVP